MTGKEVLVLSLHVTILFTAWFNQTEHYHMHFTRFNPTNYLLYLPN